MNKRMGERPGGSREAARDRIRRIAAETVEIAGRGYYTYRGRTIDIGEAQRHSEADSLLITPDRGAAIVQHLKPGDALDSGGAEGTAYPTLERPSRDRSRTDYRVVNESAVKTVHDLAAGGAKRVGLLNFASAKNAGGGFLNGANAQEENLAAASGLYPTQLRNPGYYDANRASGTMMYTHHAVYSPDVVFFRDERGELTAPPASASVLTLPAVNYGQVLLKGEDPVQAKAVMLERMRIALAIFAERGDRTLILGAYGCGVFRNDPADVASWWRRLLDGEGWAERFDEVVFAVLDHSKDGNAIRAFERIWGRAL